MNFKTTIINTSLAAFIATGAQAATITFDAAEAGGDIKTDGVWVGDVAPTAGDDGVVNTNAILINNNTLGTWSDADSYTYGGGIVIGVGSTLALANSAATATDLSGLTGTNNQGDYGHTNVGVSIFDDAALHVNDDIFSNGSEMIFNAGSSTLVGDDFEANGSSSTITINGGTHVVGDRFGQQNGSTISVLGGSVSAAGFRLDTEGTFNLGGDGTIVISGGPNGPDDNGYAGVTNVLSGWTGSFSIASYDEAAWIAQIDTEGFTIDGDAATVDDFLINGDTISLIPEPSSAALLGLGGLALILRRRK